MPHKKKVNDANDDGRFVPRLEETLPPRRRALVFLRRPVLRFEQQRAFFRRRVRVRDDDDDDDKNRDFDG